jgi:archaellin
MLYRFYSNHPESLKNPANQKGSVAIEVAIIAIAGFIVAVLGAVALLSSSFVVTNTGKGIISDGFTGSASQLIARTGVIAESGEIDVDGNDVILLSGVDELAIAKLKFIVEVSTDVMVDLTPPKTVDDTLTDPDSSGLTPRTYISVSWNEFTTIEAEWTVTFKGDTNGDYFLEKGERAELTIWLYEYDGTNVLYDLGSGTSDGFVDTATELLQARDTFTLEILVDGSTSLLLQRTLPLELGTSDLLD